MLPAGYTIDPMRRDEVNTLETWAAEEGWNPGLADLGIAWDIDPDAFIALRQGDILAGGGTIFSYEGRFGFMGLFIMRRDLRRAGLGTELWHARLARLRERLQPGACIGMDGVFAMVPFYTRGGFALAYRDLRFEGIADGEPDPAAVDLATVPWAELLRFDNSYVPAPRAAFLQRWITQPGAHALALREDAQLAGYGVARPCRVGYKLGPVFARDAGTAERLVASLCARCRGRQVQLDVPEPNTAGVALAQRFGLRESFGCARMYYGGIPSLPVERIFGVTSFEFG